MPSRFCDQEDPCPLLRKAATQLLSPDFGGKGFEVHVSGRAKKSYRVYFEYCPFCGTRIDQKFISLLPMRR